MEGDTVNRMLRVAPLSRGEQIELARVYRTGIEPEASAALDRLITTNVRLVARYASKHADRTKSLAFEDLLQEGLLGLRHGLTKFDPDRGVTVGTYVTYWIKVFIARAIENTDALIRVPVGVQEDTRHGRDTAGTRAAEKVARIASLDKKITTTEDPIGALIPDPSTEAMFEGVEDSATVTVLMEQAGLDDIERRVIELRFGLDGGGQRTRAEVGLALGVGGREPCRRIELAAMEKLRAVAA